VRSDGRTAAAIHRFTVQNHPAYKQYCRPTQLRRYTTYLGHDMTSSWMAPFMDGAHD
jgi:hypothetical protein